MKEYIFTFLSFVLMFHCQVFAEIKNPVIRASHAEALNARPLDLSSVRLLGGPLKQAQDLDAEYLLKLEPDRMLSYYRQRAGLKGKAEPYTGWDGGGRNLTGHIAGHYLSAVSLMWAATGDERFKKRADYVVRELKEVQDKHGDGYLVALEGGRECFDAVAQGNIRSSGFDLNGLWAPWYVLHKMYAGLRDAYRYTGNDTALQIEIKFAQWAEGILSKLTDAQIQRMLNTEFGGMNEVLAAQTPAINAGWTFPTASNIAHLSSRSNATRIFFLVSMAIHRCPSSSALRTALPMRAMRVTSWRQAFSGIGWCSTTVLPPGATARTSTSAGPTC